jgi:hypothetical protein
MKTWIRPFHRWTSIAFTSGVIIYIACMSQGQPPAWVGLLAAVPLLLLLVTGLYLFATHYSRKLS